MVTIPQQLFQKAIAYGLMCVPAENGAHRIQPESDAQNWYLVCHKEVWVLVVDGYPQIRLRYHEVLQFIERSAQRTAKPFSQKQPCVAPKTPDVLRALQSA